MPRKLKCYRCGEILGSDPVFVAIHRTGDPFEPFCPECSKEVDPPTENSWVWAKVQFVYRFLFPLGMMEVNDGIKSR